MTTSFQGLPGKDSLAPFNKQFAFNKDRLSKPEANRTEIARNLTLLSSQLKTIANRNGPDAQRCIDLQNEVTQFLQQNGFPTVTPSAVRSAPQQTPTPSTAPKPAQPSLAPRVVTPVTLNNVAPATPKATPSFTAPKKPTTAAPIPTPMPATAPAPALLKAQVAEDADEASFSDNDESTPPPSAKPVLPTAQKANVRVLANNLAKTLTKTLSGDTSTPSTAPSVSTPQPAPQRNTAAFAAKQAELAARLKAGGRDTVSTSDVIAPVATTPPVPVSAPATNAATALIALAANTSATSSTKKVVNLGIPPAPIFTPTSPGETAEAEDGQQGEASPTGSLATPPDLNVSDDEGFGTLNLDEHDEGMTEKTPESDSSDDEGETLAAAPARSRKNQQPRSSAHRTAPSQEGTFDIDFLTLDLDQLDEQQAMLQQKQARLNQAKVQKAAEALDPQITQVIEKAKTAAQAITTLNVRNANISYETGKTFGQLEDQKRIASGILKKLPDSVRLGSHTKALEKHLDALKKANEAVQKQKFSRNLEKQFSTIILVKRAAKILRDKKTIASGELLNAETVEGFKDNLQILRTKILTVHRTIKEISQHEALKNLSNVVRKAQAYMQKATFDYSPELTTILKRKTADVEKMPESDVYKALGLKEHKKKS